MTKEWEEAYNHHFTFTARDFIDILQGKQGYRKLEDSLPLVFNVLRVARERAPDVDEADEIMRQQEGNRLMSLYFECLKQNDVSDEETRERIETLIDSHPEVIGLCVRAAAAYLQQEIRRSNIQSN